MGDDLKGMDVLIFSQMFTKDYFPARFVISGIIFEEVIWLIFKKKSNEL